MGENGILKIAFCALGIYGSFLTWALVQEPLITKVWDVSKERFDSPNVIAIVQAFAAVLIGYLYLKWKGTKYSALQMAWDNRWDLVLTSFTQSMSAPMASYSLQYVDYLMYMLAKSCKIIPILLVHLLLYRTPISKENKLVAILVTAGVSIFTFGSNSGGKQSANQHASSAFGFALLGSSLFMDGLTNATQDKMLKFNRQNVKDGNGNSITGAHLMVALNSCIVLWNLSYLIVVDRSQWIRAFELMTTDFEIVQYLAVYALCGSLGQCFIFFTLENYGSLVLVMITVTRKMMSMLLSIIIFGKTVNFTQCIGIAIVFLGISWEAVNKKKLQSKKQKSD